MTIQIEKTLGCFFSQGLRLLGWIMMLGLLACAQPQPDESLARVGESFSISVGDLQSELRLQSFHVSKKTFKDHEKFLSLKRRVLQEMLDRRMLFEAARASGIEVTEEELEIELRRYKNQYTEIAFQETLQEVGVSHEAWLQRKREELLIKKYIEQLAESQAPVDIQQAKQYYDSHPEEFRVPAAVRLRQIVTDSKEKAESILRRLRNGENFAKLAQDLSLSPDREQGGDLGFIEPGHFPREFDVAFSMNPGEISPIIPSAYGFHLFKVLERRPEWVRSWEEAEAGILLQLKQQARRESREKLLRDLRGKTNVEIREEVLEKVSL